MSVRVKICCIETVEEARLAVTAGADALGLVAEMPSGPGVIDDDEIRAIAARVPPPVATFLLSSRTEPEEIAEHVLQCGTNTLQLVDTVDPRIYVRLRALLPYVKLVQAIHVEDRRAIEQAQFIAASVDAILLDSGRPGAARRELGGTGRTHDWSISRELVETVDVPVFLAGGLSADNVAEAIDTVRPYGLDLCSGVRTDGKLDADKLAAFMQAVQAVQAAPDPPADDAPC